MERYGIRRQTYEEVTQRRRMKTGEYGMRFQKWRKDACRGPAPRRSTGKEPAIGSDQPRRFGWNAGVGAGAGVRSWLGGGRLLCDGAILPKTSCPCCKCVWRGQPKRSQECRRWVLV